MKIVKKPDIRVFASGAKTGEILSFPDVLRGWGITLDQTQGKPPIEWMNDAFNRIDLNNLYLLQQGIPEWDGAIRYPINSIIKHADKIYLCTAENENNEPSSASDKWSLYIRNASEKDAGILKLATQAEVNTGTNDTNAVTPKKLAEKLKKLPEASLTQKGIVQLTNTVDDSEDKSATPKSVNTVKKIADSAKSAADAAQNTANTANTAAKNADTKAGAAQTTATEAKTAAATADSKAVAAQNTANTANTAAKNADTKAGAAQTKASQVPNPVANNFLVGNTATAYKLMTVEQVKTLLGVPAAAKLYSGTGQATDGAMTQKAVSDEFDKIYKRSYKNETANRKSTVTYTNPTDQEIWVFVESDGGWNITTILTAAVNGVEFIISAHNSANNNVNAGCFAVPARAKYAVSASNTITRWTEYKK